MKKTIIILATALSTMGYSSVADSDPSIMAEEVMPCDLCVQQFRQCLFSVNASFDNAVSNIGIKLLFSLVVSSQDNNQIYSLAQVTTTIGENVPVPVEAQMLMCINQFRVCRQGCG